MDSNENPSQEDRDIALISQHVNDLSEFFDTVHIFCARHESNDIGTINANKGAGNWNARYGQIREWILKEEECFRVDARRGMTNE